MANSVGLPEFNVLRVYEDSDGRSLMYEVEAAAPPADCPKCGCLGPHYKHSVDERIVQDIPSHGKLTYLKIKSRRYKCKDCGATFQEEYECVDGQERLTLRFREYIQDLCLTDTFARIARDNSLSDNTVRRIFQEYIDRKAALLVYKAPRVLGIDEDHVNKIFRFVITDCEHNELLDILPDRETATIINFFQRMDEKQNVEVVTMDMYRPYRAIIKKTFPSATIVIDKFHVIQLTNRKMDDVRKSIRDKMNSVERKRFLYLSKLMKSNKEDISERSSQTLRDAFVQYPTLGTAYYLKEHIRDMYDAPNRYEAGLLFNQVRRSVPSDCEPLVTLRNSLEEWAEEIMNYFDHPYTNAYTESANNLIKAINKASRSMSFEQLRYKVLFATKATKLPKFQPKKATYVPSDAFKKVTAITSLDDLFPARPHLERGFGVDIEDLITQL